MIALLLFLINFSQKGIDDQPIIYDGISDIYASEFVFISTQLGIYTFDRNSETWGRITEATGLPDNQADIIGLDEGILWVATPGGLASADVRINDWQTYKLPGVIEGLSFDEEYVWVGGDFGIKRFNKYVETWEDVAEFKVNHMFSEKNYIWFATDSGVLRYNREFEKIEKLPAAPQYHYSHIVNTPGRIWFISQDHFVSYRKDIEDWSIYNALKITDYSNLNDSLFVVSEGKVYLYEPKADNWIPFRDIEGLHNVNGIFVTGENILFATNKGLLIYNWVRRDRKFYNRSNGLEIDSLVDVYQETKFIFVVSRYDIEFLDTETAMWLVEKIKPGAVKREKIFYLDEAGAHSRLVKDTDIKLQGRAYYSETRTISASLTTRSDYENVNLKLIGLHSSNRLFSLYYDDTDKEHVMYGFGYRGIDKDILYKCNGGYLKSEYYEFDLIPQFSTFGGNAKLRYKTHSMDLQGGQLKSRLRNNFFTGRSTKKNLSLFDTNYNKNTFYYIYSMPQVISKGVDTVFVDDRISSNNKIDTRRGFTIAGITGDFDLLINSIDYFINYNRGIIHFLNPRGNSEIIVLLLNGEEIVIQSETVTEHALENVYLVGPNIIPNSFEMVITDTLGQIHSLSEFGLDNNGDNHVDAEFINHDLGYLSFPQPRPFPDEVYDNMLHIYTMDIQFLSLSAFYYLSYKPILIGSEKVYVDGELMTRGTHYVVDYTSGVLLFLQEDIISDFSEIEVLYSSVERERSDMFYSVQPNIRIGNYINIAPGFSTLGEEEILHVSGKLQTGTLGNKDVKFIPQVAINSEKEWAQVYSLIAKYKIFSINTEYKGFSKKFESFGVNEKKYGQLKHGSSVLLGVEPSSYVRLEGKFKRENHIDSLNRQHTVKYTYGRIKYMNPKLPNGYIILGRDYLPDYEKNRIQINVNYNFQVFESKIKLNSVVRSVNVELDKDNKNRVVEYIIGTNFSLPFPVCGDIYFRRNNLYTKSSKKMYEEEIRGILNIDVIPGLYYSGNYNLQATTFYVDVLQDLTLRNYFYNNLNVAPGRWYSHLSIINFTFGMGNNFGEYMGNLPAHYRRPFLIFNPLVDSSLSSISNVKNYYASLQFTPYSNILIWAKRTFSKSGFSYYSISKLKPILTDEIRIEFEPENLGFFITSWYRRIAESYPIKTDQNIYFEWSKPWSALLRTKLITNYRFDEKDYMVAKMLNSELKGNFETLFRFSSKSYIIVNIGGARLKNYLNEIDYSVIPGVGLNLNLFRFLYLQFDYESTFPLDGSAAHILSSKITGQF